MPVVNYPSEEFYKDFISGMKDFEYIILWMLVHNENCQWSIFTQEPLSFTTSTLSKYLNLLKGKGFVENYIRGHYKVTSEGRKRFREISSIHGAKKKNKVSTGYYYEKKKLRGLDTLDVV